jgi:glycosyltransferase involved in cell wall biosynthesis
MLSFVVPAHNEAELIGGTLAALHAAAQLVGQPYEIIVVDDASTDRTAALARDQGARVTQVNCRNIAATRNAGAREASGEWLFFVDADTVVPSRALDAALRALRQGAIGGGAGVRFDGPVPLYARILERVVLPLLLPLLKMAPGCFLFCTRQAYVGAGGFDESRSWAEEVIFSNRLKRQGRFVMLREFVITSGRKVRTHSALDLLCVGFRLARGQPEGLDFWYGPRRTRTPNS